VAFAPSCVRKRENGTPLPSKLSAPALPHRAVGSAHQNDRKHGSHKHHKVSSGQVPKGSKNQKKRRPLSSCPVNLDRCGREQLFQELATETLPRPESGPGAGGQGFAAKLGVDSGPGPCPSPQASFLLLALAPAVGFCGHGRCVVQATRGIPTVCRLDPIPAGTPMPGHGKTGCHR